ncbi:MAG: phage major capsid protein [Bacteroidetes bacterium]|nr:MAG: phage major capsid protein [Bacteroidota bacterium]
MEKEKESILKEMRGMLSVCETEKRGLTPEESKEYTGLESRLDMVMKSLAIRKEEEVINARSKEATGKSEFENLGEFLHAVVYRHNDARLAGVECREMSMGEGAGGGYMVPKKFMPEMKSVSPAGVVVRPRATVIPAGDPPDAELELPALDQGSAQNMYGGIVVAPTAEGATKNLTDMKVKMVKLTPHEVSAYMVCTDKLLRNWQGANALISQQFNLAINGWEDTQFITGLGVGAPLGIINSPARIERTRAGANAIAIADIDAMYARIKEGGSLVWIASPTVKPQLTGLVDANNNRIWTPIVSEAIPSTLYGIPIIFNDRSPALGSRGDLILADLGYYLIKDGSGPFVSASEHVYFTSNKTVIKVFWNVDGAAWLTEPLGLEGSATNTISPFVVLK